MLTVVKVLTVKVDIELLLTIKVLTVVKVLTVKVDIEHYANNKSANSIKVLSDSNSSKGVNSESRYRTLR